MTNLPSVRGSRRSQGGFSLVELMVAALIGLIGTIVIFQVFAVFEGQKRTTTGGGDAQSSLALAMHQLERDARQAGFGLIDPNFFGCVIDGWHEINGTAFTLPFVPVSITQGSATPDPVSGSTPAPDTLTFFYGSSQIAHFPPKLIANMATPAADYRVSNRHGFEVGDVLVAAEIRMGAPVCTMSQVQDLPAAAGSTDVIVHASGSYDLAGATTATAFNKSDLGPNYNFETTRIFNLGRTPVANAYTVSNGQLLLQGAKYKVNASGRRTVIERFFDAPAPIMDGIVQMQARYGKDTSVPPDNIVDTYDEIAPTTPAEWARVLSIRLALVARVGQYEKDPVSPATMTLWTAGPTWTLTAEERHYRYRVLDTIIPVRNMIWRRPTT
jgi:type IV pilus assembly protein PilW